MKKKINNALNDLDERLIQEAAQAERLESNVPKILKRALIPIGVAAAAGLCMFALANRPDGGVDLTDPASESSISAPVIPAGDVKTNPGDILPYTMKLFAPSREYAEEIIFGSEFPTLIYADDNRIVFTDIGRCVYIYDRGMGQITYSANVYDALKNTVGENISDFQHDCWNGIGFSAAADGTVVITFTDAQSDKYTYSLDESTGILRRLTTEYDRYQPERTADFGSGSGADIIITGEDHCVGIYVDMGGYDSSESGLRIVKITDYAVNDGIIQAVDEISPFGDDYFDSLKMENKYLGVYQCDDSIIRFDTRAMTFEWDMLLEMNSLCSGSYYISQSESQSEEIIMLDDDITGRAYEFAFEDGVLVAVHGIGDTEGLESGRFVKRYGRDIITAAEDVDIKDQIIDEAENNVEMPEYADILKKEEYFSQSILDYQSKNGLNYDSKAASQLIKNMIYPLGGSHYVITTFNGYDEWRGGTHYGIDIGDGNIGDAEIYAPLDGTVIEAAGEGCNGGIGSYIIIDHGSGLSTVYAHCGEVNVTEGQQVSQGEVIGTVGKSGCATGYQLHFEIRENGEVLSEDMDIFTGMFGLTDHEDNSDIISQNYTKSITIRRKLLG